MAIIYSYPENTNILGTDMLVGTSTVIRNGRPKNQTKSFSVASLMNFVGSGYALNSEVVHNTGNENVGGIKTFNDGIAVGPDKKIFIGGADNSDFAIFSTSISSLGQDVLVFGRGGNTGEIPFMQYVEDNGNLYIAARTLIGTTVDNGVDTLQVNGPILATTIKKSGALANQLLKADGGVTVGYKVYTALLTRVGATAPSAVILENTLGTITFGYIAQGIYTVSSSSLFTLDKTAVFIQNQPSGSFGVVLGASRSSSNNIIIIQSTSSGTSDNNWGDPVSIEIRVYN